MRVQGAGPEVIVKHTSGSPISVEMKLQVGTAIEFLKLILAFARAVPLGPVAVAVATRHG